MRASAPLTELGFKVAVIVNSAHARYGSVDELGSLALASLHARGVFDISYHIQPAKADALRRRVMRCREEGADLVLMLGGPAFGAMAHAPQVLGSLADRETEFAQPGFITLGALGQTLMAAVPGSASSLRRSLATLYPMLFDAWFDLAQAA